MAAAAAPPFSTASLAAIRLPTWTRCSGAWAWAEICLAASPAAQEPSRCGLQQQATWFLCCPAGLAVQGGDYTYPLQLPPAALPVVPVQTPAITSITGSFPAHAGSPPAQQHSARDPHRGARRPSHTSRPPQASCGVVGTEVGATPCHAVPFPAAALPSPMPCNVLPCRRPCLATRRLAVAHAMPRRRCCHP